MDRGRDRSRIEGASRRARRRMLAALAAALLPVAQPSRAARTLPRVEVWKSPACGCCKEWIAHLRANGFEVVAFDTGNAAARARLGVPEAFGSCHTARVEGYVVEGHVPAADIQRLLRERPAALGLAVPGMPIGSPGMEQGSRRDPYDVLLVLRDGTSRVYRAYR